MSQKKIQVRPGKGSSGMAFVVGIIFCAIGLFVAIPMAGVFGILWTLIAVVITVFHGINTFSDKGASFHEITIEEEQEQEAFSGQRTAEERLTELRRLYESGLITGEEYETKKKEILEEL